MKHLSPVDPSDERCWCPRFGNAFSAAMAEKGWTPRGLANALKIDVSNVLGYRRGFQRNRPSLTPTIEKLLGAKLPYDEPRPTAAKKAAIQPSLPLDDPRLTHLAALALGMGYTTTFTPIGA